MQTYVRYYTETTPEGGANGRVPPAHPPPPAARRPCAVYGGRERPAAEPAPVPPISRARRAGGAGGWGERLRPLPALRRRSSGGARPPPGAGRGAPLAGIHVPPARGVVRRASPPGDRRVP